MTNILDISRSGLLAYRTALAVTAENIANVGTDGYRRRDVSTVTASGGQSTATTLPTGGQGVSLTDVRRAFDDLAAERARTAQAGEAAATAHLAGARAIETLMIPGDDGIDGTLRQFFDSLSRLAGNPTDSVTRALTLAAAGAVTESVSDLAAGMSGLRSDLLGEAQRAVQEAQALLEELALVSKRMAEVSVSSGAPSSAIHPLADRRDTLLGELAQLLPVSVTLNEDGRPTVRFGSAAGPLLLQGTQTAKLSVSAPDQLSLHIQTADGATRETRMLSSARIGGLSRAIGSLDMAMAELDAFARTLSQSMNMVHRSGIDQLGVQGGDLFRIDGWQAQPAPANAGTVQIAITPTQTTGPREAMELLYDGTANLWRALDGDGQELGASADRLVLFGVTIDLAGRAVHGDRIAITPVTGRAIDLRLAISDPARLAAASAFATTSSPANVGSGSMTASVVELPASPLPDLAGFVGGAAIDLSAGPIGMVRSGSEAVTLSSLGRAAMTVLPPLTGATRLDLSLETGADGFNLEAVTDAADLAAALNGGSLRSDKGFVLAALGLVASTAADGSLILSRPGAESGVGASLSGPDGTVSGVPSMSESTGGTIQVITRNGRHVAGSPLTAEQVLALMTPANGFLPDAVYDPSPLTGITATGYRGVQLDGFLLAGPQSATLDAGTLTVGATLPLAATPARSLTVYDGSGNAAPIDLPAGSSAALMASRLMGALPGLTATGVTALELTGFGPGQVSFALMGANGSPLAVSAMLSGTDASPLSNTINALSAVTGVRAEVSPDGARLLLVQADGHDIILSGLVSSQSAGLSVTPTGSDGQPHGAAALWVPGTVIRQAGQVHLTASQSFSLIEGMDSISSAPVGDSAIASQSFAAGAGQRLTFRDVPLTAEGGLLHRLTIGTATYEAAAAPGASAAQIAATLAAVMRSAAPDAVLTGQPLAAVPQDGSAMTLRVDGAAYVLRMQGGLPVISGPEAGRMTARFDADNRLVIEARGITDGTGIGLVASPAFGFAAGVGRLVLTGQPPDAANLPASLTVSLGGTSHILTLGPGNLLDVPPDFPGQAMRDPVTGALRLTVPAPADGLLVTPSAEAGFGGPGAAVRVEGAQLSLVSASAPLGLSAEVLGSLGQQLVLRNLPPEDLVVAFTGTGTLRLAGSVTEGRPAKGPGALSLEILDAATGRVALSDAITGHRVAEGALDSSGRVTLAGLTLRLSGTPATGDRFSILPAPSGSSNADNALALAALRNPDATTGSPGLTERFSRLQADVGLRAAAAARSLATAKAAAEASEREQAAIGAVDLDTEAARLLELQQAYQASAQAAAVARDLFDTLLKMF